MPTTVGDAFGKSRLHDGFVKSRLHERDHVITSGVGQNCTTILNFIVGWTAFFGKSLRLWSELGVVMEYQNNGFGPILTGRQNFRLHEGISIDQPGPTSNPPQGAYYTLTETYDAGFLPNRIGDAFAAGGFTGTDTTATASGLAGIGGGLFYTYTIRLTLSGDNAETEQMIRDWFEFVQIGIDADVALLRTNPLFADKWIRVFKNFGGFYDTNRHIELGAPTQLLLFQAFEGDNFLNRGSRSYGLSAIEMRYRRTFYRLIPGAANYGEVKKVPPNNVEELVDPVSLVAVGETEDLLPPLLPDGFFDEMNMGEQWSDPRRSRYIQKFIVPPEGHALIPTP